MAVAEEGRSILVLTDKALRSLSLVGEKAWQIPCQNRPPDSASGLALGADHGRAFGNSAQRLSQISCAANEGYRKLCLINVAFFIRRS